MAEGLSHLIGDGSRVGKILLDQTVPGGEIFLFYGF
jgi:hypothetical protein